MYTIVTAFHKKHHDIYAKAMLESVIKFWQHNDFRLVVYLQGYGADLTSLPSAEFIEYRNLDLCTARDNFIARNNVDVCHGMGNGEYNFRFDAIRFCHKVFAYTEFANELINNDFTDWLVWLDADTATVTNFTANDAAKILPKDAEIVHLGRTVVDYSETSFMAFNMASQKVRGFVTDMRTMYDINEVFGYREWHDGFVFTRLLNLYKSHGLVEHDLSAGFEGLAAFKNSILNDYFIHYKGNLKYQNNAPAESATFK